MIVSTNEFLCENDKMHLNFEAWNEMSKMKCRKLPFCPEKDYRFEYVAVDCGGSEREGRWRKMKIGEC
jgi:hypothetical protein